MDVAEAVFTAVENCPFQKFKAILVPDRFPELEVDVHGRAVIDVFADSVGNTFGVDALSTALRATSTAFPFEDIETELFGLHMPSLKRAYVFQSDSLFDD